MERENKNPIDIRETKKIKFLARMGYDKIWVETPSGEALILPKKYGKEWWKKADKNDIGRITIH